MGSAEVFAVVLAVVLAKRSKVVVFHAQQRLKCPLVSILNIYCRLNVSEMSLCMSAYVAGKLH